MDFLLAASNVKHALVTQNFNTALLNFSLFYRYPDKTPVDEFQMAVERFMSGVKASPEYKELMLKAQDFLEEIEKK